MKLGLPALALILGFGLAVPALAQEDPKKDEPAKEETPAPDAAKPAEEAAPDEAAKPAEKAAPAAAAKPAAEAEATPAPAKELSSCAKAFVPLADSYKSAYDDMEKWIGEINAQTAAANDKVQSIQKQIQTNEAAITQAKLDKDDSKAKTLQKDTKKLWDDLNTAKKDQSAACSKFAKDAPQKVKQYADATNKALDAAKAQAK